VNEGNIDRVEKAISAGLERVNEENVERIEKRISAVLERD
jgi:hypothetical protein